MKIGIYSPYLDTVGGGERYMLSIAEILSKEYPVDIFLDTHLATLDIDKIKEKTSRLLDLDLSEVKFVKAPFGRGIGIWERSKFLKKYDLLFYLTDGSIFYSSSKKSILHIQSPIKVSNGNFWKKIKKSSWDLIIYNSKFTKENCQKYWGLKSEVIYPPVNIESFNSRKKKKQILTVGRFFGFLKDKKHSLMINTFKKMADSGKVKDWSFHLVGGAGEGDKEYVKELQDIAGGYPVYLHPNLPFEELKKMYGESSIYWHAAGFGETDPTRMEHFGITTVEAMASGCVPVVINLGGQKEIVEEGVSGLLWDEPEEMESKTMSLMGDEKLTEKLSKSAQESVRKFSKEEFSKKIKDLL